MNGAKDAEKGFAGGFAAHGKNSGNFGDGMECVVAVDDEMSLRFHGGDG